MDLDVGGNEVRAHRVCGGLAEQSLRAALDGADGIGDETGEIELELPVGGVDLAKVQAREDVIVDGDGRVFTEGPDHCSGV